MKPTLIALLVFAVGCETTPQSINQPLGFTETPGMQAAKKAQIQGQYSDAIRLYTAELAKEEAKAKPGWRALAYLNERLGIALVFSGQYDKALEHHQKALAIRLQQLGADHPDVATSYWGIGAAWRGKKDIAKAKEFIGKAYSIFLKKLGPNHPDTKDQLDALR